VALQTLNPPPAPPAPPIAPQPQFNPGTPRRRRFFDASTLAGRFQILALAVTLLALIAMIVSYFVLENAQNNFNQIVVKITPSIDAAQRLGQSLEEMDARAADYQLTSRVDVTSPDLNANIYGITGTRQLALSELDERRRRVDNALALARSNATLPGEAEAVNVISNRFYDYFAAISLMRYELDQGRKEAALANYKAAQDILVGNLGNPERDARGNSREKALKDNNWRDLDFTCVENCSPATLNKPVRITFDSNPQSSYQGLAANIRKLSEINRKKLDEISNFGTLETALVTITVGLVLIVIAIGAVYYALITHRVLNIGFGLALLAGIITGLLLITNLSSASRDFNDFSKKYIPAVISTSAVQQLSAGASADISRLLLSPDSPGLDSTSPALTRDVKKAFSRDTLVTAYDVKKAQVEQEMGRLSNLIGLENNDRQIRTNFCAAFAAQNICPPNSAEPAWNTFNQQVTRVRDSFDKRLLADSININLTGARDPYNRFADSVGKIATEYKTRFDQSSCRSIGQSEFGNQCGGDFGYLNMLQILVLAVFPLLAILVLGGVWFATSLF
jgi:hypothetical protein